MEATQVKVRPLDIPDVLLVEPQVFRDLRGHFLESWSSARYAEAGIHGPFVQDNVALSPRRTLRGLHYQHPSGQGKLVSVLSGLVFDVAVDIRRGSASFGRWIGLELTGDACRQLYIPPGFAHGYQVLSESAVFHYKCTEYYRQDVEGAILWSDEDIGIDWPLGDPILSTKDEAAPRLREVAAERLPRFTVGD